MRENRKQLAKTAFQNKIDFDLRGVMDENHPCNG